MPFESTPIFNYHPLKFACEKGWLELVDAFLKLWPDIYEQHYLLIHDSLDLAREKGHAELLCRLLYSPVLRKVSTFYCFEHGSIDILADLLRLNQDVVNQRSLNEGKTLLQLAFEKKDLKVAKIVLLVPDLSFNVGTMRAQPITEWILKSGDEEVRSLLIKRFSPEECMIILRNPTYWGDHRLISHLASHPDVVLSLEGPYQKSLLQLAVENNEHGFVDILLETGKISLTDRAKGAMEAASRGYLDLFSRLSQACIKTDLELCVGLAIIQRRHAILEYILDSWDNLNLNGVDPVIQAKLPFRHSYFIAAAEYGDLTSMELLIDRIDIPSNFERALFEDCELALIWLFGYSGLRCSFPQKSPEKSMNKKLGFLIHHYLQDPISNIIKIRRSTLPLKILREMAAKIFLMTLLTSEGYYALNNQSPSPESHFFRILLRLPLELQMLICNLTFHVSDMWISSDSLKAILKRFKKNTL